MRQVSKTAQTDDIARAIGFDMYRYNISLNEMQSVEAVQHGYREAQERNAVKVARSSMITRKLMQIRIRAFLKGIDVTISEADLQSAYEQCKGICPVTLKPMTSAEAVDTDWSVDRLDNDLGYAPDNIVVMSSIANRAKGGLSLHDLIVYGIVGQCSEANKARFGSQTERFWKQMLKAYYLKMPDYLFASVMKEICSDKQYKNTLLTALLLHIMPSFRLEALNQTRRYWLDSPFLSKYIKDGTINESSLKKMRKTINNSVEALKTTDINLSPLERIQAINILLQETPRSTQIIQKLTEIWEQEIESNAERRILMMRALIQQGYAKITAI